MSPIYGFIIIAVLIIALFLLIKIGKSRQKMDQDFEITKEEATNTSNAVQTEAPEVAKNENKVEESTEVTPEIKSEDENKVAESPEVTPEIKSEDENKVEESPEVTPEIKSEDENKSTESPEVTS